MAMQPEIRDGELLLYSFYNTRTVDQRVSQRISQTDLAALKHADTRAQSAATSGMVQILAVFRSITDYVGDIVYRPVKKHAMCDNYGHIADASTWTDHLPKCADCGIEINNKSLLRKSVPLK